MEANTKEHLFSTMLQYAEAHNTREDLLESNREHLERLQNIVDLQEKQRRDLTELRNSIEYINRHTHVIQSALREANNNQAAVPLCSNIVKDILAVRTNIQDSINNATEIKQMLGINYQPLMENLLQRMESQLNSWSGALNIASRNLVNSRALIDNIQNLIVSQQQMCSEVVSSGLFACLETENVSSPSNSSKHDTMNSQQFDISGKCSTPISFKENSIA